MITEKSPKKICVFLAKMGGNVVEQKGLKSKAGRVAVKFLQSKREGEVEGDGRIDSSLFTKDFTCYFNPVGDEACH